MQICEDVLANEELNASNRMKDGNFAAYRTTEGFDIFKIVGEPYPLEHDGDEVEGCPEMPAGTVVCKGIYWNKVRGISSSWLAHSSSSAQSQEICLQGKMCGGS